MEWSCSKCTFLNTEGIVCQVCKNVAADTTGLDTWTCPSCTFSNASSSLLCELCDKEKPDNLCKSAKRKRDESFKNEVAVDKSKDEQVANALLRELHAERVSRLKQKNEMTSSIVSEKIEPVDSIVFMTYNVWFQETQIEARMGAIGELIKHHKPHVICFQEVTGMIYELFRRSDWWSQYSCSVSPELPWKRAYFCMMLSKLSVDRFYRNPFRNSVMGRELCLADLKVGDNLQLVVATTHLESPCPAPPTWNQMYSPERVAQAKQAFSTLSPLPNVIFGGDMNWNDKLDGRPPCSDEWIDAWAELCPNQAGMTYDTKANAMLAGNRLLQMRLDRIFCRFQDFQLESIEMIGTQPISGLSYHKEKTVRKQKQLVTLPVLPSDHFGLLLKIRKKQAGETSTPT